MENLNIMFCGIGPITSEYNNGIKDESELHLEIPDDGDVEYIKTLLYNA